MEFKVANPIDTSISQRLKRERGEIIQKFKDEYFNDGKSSDPLAYEKRRFTQNVTKHYPR
jgi:hypothetical protein